MTKLQRIRGEIVRSLTDPRALAKALNLDQGAKQQHGGVHVLCPWNAEKTPSCSISRAPDGPGLRVHCFGCQETGDAITLIAHVRGIRTTRGRDFVAVLREAALIAGRNDLVSDLDAPPDSKPATKRQPKPKAVAVPDTVSDTPRELPPVSYPPPNEVRSLWDDAQPAADDHDALAYLAGRGLADAAPLVRVLHSSQWLPRWAGYRGEAPAPRSWVETGHRILVATWDANGVWRSLRAIRVAGDADTPKRLPPSGYSTKGLVMANRAGVLLLRDPEAAPVDVVIVEGEPDWLTWATRTPERPVFGVIGGSWHSGFAARVPRGSRVILRTHDDPAGHRFAADIVRSLPHARVRLFSR